MSNTYSPELEEFEPSWESSAFEGVCIDSSIYGGCSDPIGIRCLVDTGGRNSVFGLSAISGVDFTDGPYEVKALCKNKSMVVGYGTLTQGRLTIDQWCVYWPLCPAEEGKQ